MEKVDEYIAKIKNWKEESKLLRQICLDCELTEDFKWMHPCYTHKGKNIVIIHGFKDYCALLFNKGVLLNDSENILVQQTKNVQSARQIRFTNSQEINKLTEVLKAYIYEAIEVEEAGIEVPMKKTAEFDMPEELKEALDKDSDFKTAFYNLTPGRQRGYLLYFGQAKQSKTRTARIEKSRSSIIVGKGLRD